MKTSRYTIEPLEARIAPAFAAVIDLASLDGLNGFKLSGVAAGDSSGVSVSDAGDVNGDSFGDVIIGATTALPSGASYVVFGAPSGFAANLNLSMLDGTNGFKVVGVAANTGFSVSAAGDFNGDGFDDLIIGALHAAPSQAGAAYMVFGRANGFTADLDFSTLDGSNGFKLSGGAAYDHAGRSVNAAGDVNGDGFDDVIVGAYGADPNGNVSGASYVIFGKAGELAADLNLTTLNGSNGFKLSGAAAQSRSGWSVSGAVDVNDDGFDDQIIGAEGAGAGAGASYVVFGKASGFASNLNLATLNGSNGFKLTGVERDVAGWSVSAAGDVNGDGFDDLIVGARDGNLGAGASYVVFGKQTGFPANLDLSTLNGTTGFKLNGVVGGDSAGFSVSTAGDINGDGFADLIIGAPYADSTGSDSGASYVVFGKASGFLANLNLSTLDGTTGFKLNGVAAGDYAGISVSAAGDVNGDGFADLVIGARSADPNGSRSGASYVVFGRGVGLSVSDASISEGNAGDTALQFTVSLSEAGNAPVTVAVATPSGNALLGGDYTPIETVVTFAPGETSKTVTVNVLGDELFESDESFPVQLSNAKGGVIKDGIGIGTIVNDDAPPLVSIVNSTVIEGNSETNGLTFTVSLSAASGLPATVRYASKDGSAISGSDYASLTPGMLTFAPGETSKTISIDVLGDTSIEDHEQLSVILSEASGAILGNGSAIGTILNDDTSVGIAGPTDALEGDTGETPLVFTITLEKPSALPVNVNYAAADGTALSGLDYAALPLGTLTFEPGETTKTITIGVVGDTSVEEHEQFLVVLAEPNGATISSGSAIATILNDDTSVGISDAALLEGHSTSGTMNFMVSLTAASALPVTVNLASADETALAGTDYSALIPATLTFAPGETSKLITVNVRGDTIVEGNESFSLRLANATNGVIADAIAFGTILDDDVTLVSRHKATFTDVDGESVVIKVTRGELKVEDFTIIPSNLGAQLALVDLSGKTEFAGTDLRITVKGRRGTDSGDYHAHVGYINATGLDLGEVLVKGDLGRIEAGDNLTPKHGLLGLSARSIGRFGLATQLPGGSLQSNIDGGVKVLALGDGMQEATLNATGNIGSITIKGDVLGSAIGSDGKIGTLAIDGDLAASATNAAIVTARGALAAASIAKGIAIGTVSIGGSVDHAQILAGYDHTGAGVNADASIGSLVVAQNWTAASLVAGVIAGPDNLFGTEDDALISSSNSLIAKIGSIVIKGHTVDSGGFVGEEISAFKSERTKLALTRGPANDLTPLPVASSGTMTVREVGAMAEDDGVGY